jgi:simple sugar transport system permease protein
MLPVVSVGVSVLAGAFFILAVGGDPLRVYGALLDGTLGSAYGIGQVLFKATPLICTGLAAAVAFRAGLFNIGLSGQMEIGTFALAVTGATLSHGAPGPLVLVISLGAGLVAGALWAGVPGVLRARLGTHEVINTLMLNFVAVAVTNYLLTRFFGVAGTMHTAEIPAALARLDAVIPAFRGSPANVSLLLALAAAAGVSVLLSRTVFGYELRAVGLNPEAARASGVSVSRVIIGAMLLSGALAALAGANFVLGYKHYYEEGFAGGAGFMGIAVALLGRNSALGVVLAALLFGLLSYGGLVINSLVPKELVDILQAVIIINVIVMSALFGDLRTRAARSIEATA